MDNETNIWPKQITVDKRIVKILSEQTYEYLPNAVKELITNSYDADASIVKINISLQSENLEMEDNGWGMDEKEFNFYLRIAGRKRKKDPTTPSGRVIIGQFGVGFLAVFPFFNTFTIETKKRASREVVYATIPCYKYFTQDRIIDITDIKIQGGVKFDQTRYAESYTKITLNGFTELTKRFFFPKNDLKPKKNSIQNYTSLEKLKWRLEEDLPIDYENKRFSDLTRQFSPNGSFSVIFNKELLSRKVYGELLLDQSTKIEKIGNIKFKYFISTNKKPIIPNEGRYLKLRNENAGVGDRTSFGLGTEVGGARSRLHWLTGEIIIVDGLNDLITVSRDSFNYNSDFENLKNFFITKLTSLSNQMEAEDEMMDYINQTKEETKIKNIKFLDPKVVEKKFQKINNQNSINNQKIVKDNHNETTRAKENTTNRVTTNTNDGYVNLPVKVPDKIIVIKNKSYTVKLDSWAYEKDLFPALKIEKNILWINDKYPLFKGKKYTDLFIKFHLIIVSSFLNDEITERSYKKMAKNIFEYFEDYS